MWWGTYITFKTSAVLQIPGVHQLEPYQSQIYVQRSARWAICSTSLKSVLSTWVLSLKSPFACFMTLNRYLYNQYLKIPPHFEAVNNIYNIYFHWELRELGALFEIQQYCLLTHGKSLVINCLKKTRSMKKEKAKK